MGLVVLLLVLALLFGGVGLFVEGLKWLLIIALAEAVKPVETTRHRFVCMSASGVGSLIQATVGSLGGTGGLANRPGLAA